MQKQSSFDTRWMDGRRDSYQAGCQAGRQAVDKSYIDSLTGWKVLSLVACSPATWRYKNSPRHSAIGSQRETPVYSV